MSKDWRKGYLTAINNDGCRTAWEAGAFISTQPEPYHIHSITGMKFYLTLEEPQRDRYTKAPFYRLYSVGVARDGNQSGECSQYTALDAGGDYPPILERFDQYHEFAVIRWKRLYPQYATTNKE